MANAQSSAGITLEFGTTDGFDADIVAVNGYNTQRTSIDVSHLNSPNQWKEFLAGMKDAGEISIDVHHDANIDIDETLYDLETDALTLTFPLKAGQTNPATFECQAFCSGYQMNGPLDDRIAATVSFKLTGQPTFTAGS